MMLRAFYFEVRYNEAYLEEKPNRFCLPILTSKCFSFDFNYSYGKLRADACECIENWPFSNFTATTTVHIDLVYILLFNKHRF